MTARWLLAAALVTTPLQSLDDTVRADVQSARRPWLEAPMHAASDDARPLLAAGVLVAAVSGAAGRAFALETAVALVPVNLLVEGTKYLTDRARPGGAHHRSNASFPSSHAANAFAVAIVLVRRWRRSALPAFAAASLVTYSRLYLDRHWFTDVVAGAVLGALVAWWAITTWRRALAARAARGVTAPPSA